MVVFATLQGVSFEVAETPILQRRQSSKWQECDVFLLFRSVSLIASLSVHIVCWHSNELLW